MFRFPRHSVTLVMVALVALMTTPAGAITFGELDGDTHPNVGVLLGEDDAGKYVLCSGTLIAPDVFLTAAHCTEEGAEVEVSFDTDASDPDSVVSYAGTAHVNSQFGVNGGGSDWYDIAVVVLDDPVPLITPATLPSAGLLDQMKADKTLRDATFTAVGYGVARDDKTGGPGSLTFDGYRRTTTQTLLSLQKTVLGLSMQPSTGDGGTCYGDSGGPHFLGDETSSLIVSITVTGDTWCRASDKTYRLDTDSARSFLDEFVGLPAD